MKPSPHPFALLLGLCLPAAAAEPGARTITGDQVNVRSQPSVSGEVIAQLRAATEVTALESRQTAETESLWVRVVLPPPEPRWIHARYVDPSTGQITGDRVNVRMRPRADAEVDRLANRGEVVKVTGRRGEWLSVVDPTPRAGWVSARYVSPAATSAPGPVVAAATPPPPPPSSASPTVPVLAPPPVVVPAAPIPVAVVATEAPPAPVAAAVVVVAPVAVPAVSAAVPPPTVAASEAPPVVLASLAPARTLPEPVAPSTTPAPFPAFDATGPVTIVQNVTTIAPSAVPGEDVAKPIPVDGVPMESTEPSRNRFRAGATLLLGARGGLQGLSVITPGGPPLRPPLGGLDQQYMDGYVKRDGSEANFSSDRTWNWGVDSTSQISPLGVVEFHSPASVSSDAVKFDDSVAPGFEVSYTRTLGTWRSSQGREISIGLDIGGGFSDVNLESDTTVYGSVVTDQYLLYTPAALAGLPAYQGTMAGPGPLLRATPARTVGPAPVGGITGELEADVFRLRLGGSVRLPISDRLSIELAVGPALGFIDAEVDWNENLPTLGRVGSHNASEFNLLLGAYGTATIDYRLSQHWGLFGGGQYEYLGTAWIGDGPIRGRLDLAHLWTVTVGVQYSF